MTTSNDAVPDDPLLALPSAIRTMFQVARTVPKLGVAHRSAENALLYAYLWQALDATEQAAQAQRAKDDPPTVVVVHDKDHGFRWYAPDELYGWLVKPRLAEQGKSPWIVWNMASPLAHGRLWDNFFENPKALERTVVIVDEDQLRHEAVDLRRDGSSERTLQEFWEQLYTAKLKRRSPADSPLARLTRCKAVVICFDGGVLLYSRDKARDEKHQHLVNEALRMYGLSPKPAKSHPGSRPERDGEMFGRDLIFASAIALAIELESRRKVEMKEKSELDLATCVEYGCRLSLVLHRAHLVTGYAPPSLNQAMYTAQRPAPFGWLFRHWFKKLEEDRNQKRKTTPSPNANLPAAKTSAQLPVPPAHRGGQIESPFESVADPQFEKLEGDQWANFRKAIETVKKSCKLTLLCSNLSAGDRKSDKKMKEAFEGFRNYSRIDEFHTPTFLDGAVPRPIERRPVGPFSSIDPAAACIVTHGLQKAIDQVSEKILAEPEKPDETSEKPGDTTGKIPDWVPRLDTGIPKPKYDWLTPLIRSDIDNYADISTLVQDYVHDDNRKRPLSLAVFGAPGSGKNTTIEALIASNDASLAKNPLTFNLSQFSDEQDLATAFHQVQDLVLTRRHLPPVVFFDEFDCSFKRDDWGWFKFFLAPMQDGEYRSGDSTYHIGRAIFIFSGGISRKYVDFEKNMTIDADPKARANFERAKGPDFVSRLRGHLDIPSINTLGAEDTPDDAMKIRRALILRTILERTLPQIIDPLSKEACIDPRIVRAMLGVPRFRHEVRSMQAIVEMSHVPKGGRVFTVAELPSDAQLSMHVEVVKSFNDLLVPPPAVEVREHAGRRSHRPAAEME